MPVDIVGATCSGSYVLQNGPSDPSFPYVTLLLPGNGTNGAQNNTFLDSSPNNFSLTKSGTPTQGTFSPYGPNWSNYFDGVNDRLTIADNAALRPGTGNFTIEAWVYLLASGFTGTIYAKGGASTGFVFQIASTNVLRFTDMTSNIDSTGTIDINTWTHVAVVREGTGSNQLKLYINGVNAGQGTVSTNFNQTEELRIGEDRGATGDFYGYISNVRFVTSAVYTSGFTPPAEPLVAISNTQLLTCQSNRFIDNSSNAFAMTVTGGVRIQRFSPFGYNSSYIPSVIGGSGFFRDGGANWGLFSPSNSAFQFGTGAFTVEAWVYFTAPRPNAGIIVQRQGAAGNNSYGASLFCDTGFGSAAMNVSGAISSRLGTIFSPTTTVPFFAWAHVVLARDASGNVGFFVNGSRIGSASTLQDLTENGVALANSVEDLVGECMAGYLSDARVVKGTAVYDPTQTTLTVPSAPLTSITNTSLLCSFTNAGVIDNAMINDLETVGNAQISTAQSKFGGGSLAFDGTGDWLAASTGDSARDNNVTQFFFAGNFTIEGWLFLNATGVAYGVVSKGAATTGWSVNITSGDKLQFSYITSQLTGTTSLVSNTWYHFAVVRNGSASGNLRIYLDGALEATSAGAVTTNFNFNNLLYIGASRTTTDPLNGYIDDLRITNGVARYTAAFTPPTSPFPTR